MTHSSLLTVTLPDIGEGVVEGEVIAWLKQEGDFLKQDEPVVVVMTDKATVELPAPQPGRLAKCYYKVGELALKDQPLYDIELGETETFSHPLAAPPVRKAAKDQGIDLHQIKGSGPEGRILMDDLTQTPAVKPAGGIQQAMAKKMAEAKTSIPDFSIFAKADLTRFLSTYQKLSTEAEKENIKLTVMPLFIRALSLTIKAHPQINSTYEDSKIHTHTHHNIGIATAGPYGLIVPVLKKVETLSLRDLIHAFEELKKRSLSNQLTPSDMKEGTISFTNFGSLSPYCIGGTPIIYAPQVSIFGIAHIQKEPAVINDEIVIRERINVNSTFDHRVVDGKLAADATNTFIEILENPVRLF
jgi:pyruvate/2-oxoglutarate dehydrogenase complex dihydrolipoamide acyltransferase (E2) component